MDTIRNRIMKKIKERLEAFPLDQNGDEIYSFSWDLVSRGSRKFDTALSSMVCIVARDEEKDYDTRGVVCRLLVQLDIFYRTSAGGDPEEEILSVVGEVERCLTSTPHFKQFDNLVDNMEVLSNDIDIDLGDGTVSSATIDFILIYKHKTGRPDKLPGEA